MTERCGVLNVRSTKPLSGSITIHLLNLWYHLVTSNYHSCETIRYTHAVITCVRTVLQTFLSRASKQHANVICIVCGCLHRPQSQRFLLLRTPCHGRVYDALPPESRVAHAQLLQPKDPKQRRACVLHLAGTGDHTWNRRLHLGGPLVQKVSQSWCFYLRIHNTSHNNTNAVVTSSQKCTIAVGFLHKLLPPEYYSVLLAIPVALRFWGQISWLLWRHSQAAVTCRALQQWCWKAPFTAPESLGTSLLLSCRESATC